ncbi:MAG: choice-of-anchor D domain-containing protein [Desulfobulbaceae bacterium]
MVKPKSLHIALVVPLALAAWISPAGAYEAYSTNQTDNCAACHGDFLATPYTSLVDSANWGDDLHDIHRNNMLSGDCATCHTTGGRVPTFLGSSDGGTGLPAIGCLGCHGRTESGGTVTGAGLRQHHWNSGVTTCGTAGCHPGDANPTSFTTVGEDVMPPYYATPDAAHPNKPTNPCNPAGEENFAGTTIGLDNDGDNLFDQNDTDCAPDINLSPLSLDFGAVAAGGSATLIGAIQNLGSRDLNVTLINLCAGTSAEFSWLPAAPFIVAPSTSQALEVTYAPVDEGIDSGCLAISSNDPDEATVQLGLNPGAGSSILRFTPAFIHPQQNGGQ